MSDDMPSSSSTGAEAVVQELAESEPIIPPGAVEAPEETPFGGVRYRCELGGAVVGHRLRDESGRISLEYVIRDGVRHGLERRWEDGELLSETRYVNGKEHGIARQWQDGKLIGTYRMQQGTGVDLWRHADGALAEEHHMVNGQRHGYVRWWSGDDRTLWGEEHYWCDEPHGMFRQWNHRERLGRGYPRYFVHGERVSKRTYLRRAASDPSLPPFRAEDNQPERALPPEYLDQIQTDPAT